MDCINLAVGNEPSGSTKCKEFPEELLVLQMDSAVWSEI